MSNSLSAIEKLEQHVGRNAICINDYNQREHTFSNGALEEINKAFERLTAELEQYRQAEKNSAELEKIQGMHGNWDSNDYMTGLYNGMEMIFAIFQEREPKYREPRADAEQALKGLEQ